MPRTLIIDAASLIALQELHSLKLLFDAAEKMQFTLVIPTTVWNEVKKNPLEAEKSLDWNDKKIQRISAGKESLQHLFDRYPKQGRGELEAIAIARELENDCIVLFDDSDARKLAGKMEVKHHGLLWLVEECCRQNVISPIRGYEILCLMETSNFRVRKDMIARCKASVRKMVSESASIKQGEASF